ncbi:MAG: carbon-nitrogen hydrolase family protein [Conexibacter sp.]
MTIRVAAVQPRSSFGAEEQANVPEALAWIDRAADAGADLVVFPEGYPGPTNPINDYDAFKALRKRAAQRRIHVVAGRIEPADDGRWYVVLHLIDDAGETVGVYRRTTPHGPYIYQDIPAWEFDYAASEGEVPVFETKLGRIGLQVCSEVYSTEQSRLLALKGADVILYPAGGSIKELIPPWSTLVWARAIENLVYTVATQNLYEDGEAGLARIAAPEAILAQRSDPGMVLADLDLERLAFLRAEDEKVESPRRCRTVPGLMRWRRSEVLSELGELSR